MLGRIRLQLGSPYQVSEFQHVPTVSNIWKGHVGSRFGPSTPPHGVFVYLFISTCIDRSSHTEFRKSKGETQDATVFGTPANFRKISIYLSLVKLRFGQSTTLFVQVPCFCILPGGAAIFIQAL
jgi:hypothetical protein